jgi:Lysozyme like domain
MIISPVQIYAYATAAGFSGTAAVDAVAVALAESGGNTTAVNSNGSNVGLWQIGAQGTVNDAGVGLSASQLEDPATNARAAYTVWSRAGGTFAHDWTTWTSGAAAAELPQVTAAGITGAQGSALGDLGSAVGTVLPGIGTLPGQLLPGAGSVVGAAESASGLAAGGLSVLEWLAVPANWGRIALVAIGGALVIGALVQIAKPVTAPLAGAVAKTAALAA